MGKATSRGNRTGRMLEKSTEALLQEFDYEKVDRDLFREKCADKQPIYARQYPTGENIYGKDRKVDFILYHPQHWPRCLVIQCKWQASSGSVEEKYPFEVLSIKGDRYKTVIILDGGGYTEGAEKWLKSQVGKHKLLAVLNQGEFQRFMKKHH